MLITYQFYIKAITKYFLLLTALTGPFTSLLEAVVLVKAVYSACVGVCGW